MKLPLSSIGPNDRYCVQNRGWGSFEPSIIRLLYDRQSGIELVHLLCVG
jgi:hypothetical protein